MKISYIFTKSVKPLIERLSIAKKIGYGYSIAIGIAVLGTTIGLTLGNYYQNRAQEELVLADRQQYLLQRLDKEVLKVQAHPQELASVLQDPIWFKYETSKFSVDVILVKNILSELEAFADRNYAPISSEEGEIEELVKKYNRTIDSYANFIKSLWYKIEKLNFKKERLREAKLHILDSLAEKRAVRLRIDLERLSETLIRLENTAEWRREQANQELLRAEALRLKIIVTSILGSVALSIFLAIRTSRAIARPIEEVTQVAQKVVQESNFNLQSSVKAKDEVGILAASLNQLIHWVGKYTRELEEARQTLEDRVKKRTRELEEARQTLEDRVEERTRELKETLENLRKTQAQLVQTEKMSSIGQMVAGVAHEINNPVSFIYGNITYADEYLEDLLYIFDLYQQTYPDPTPEIQAALEELEVEFLLEDFQQLLMSMKVGAKRIGDIVLSLRNFSRLDEAELKYADIHEGLDNTLLILQHRLKLSSTNNDIQVLKEYGNLPLLECYSGQLNQVFINLLGNAIDALESSGINQQNSDAETQYGKEIPLTLRIGTEVTELNSAVIRIADNGCGMSEEIRKKIFDPFFTTKPVGSGTGLGLSISYQIVVEKHGGNLSCISAPGKGAEFVIELPIRLSNSELAQ